MPDIALHSDITNAHLVPACEVNADRIPHEITSNGLNSTPQNGSPVIVCSLTPTCIWKNKMKNLRIPITAITYNYSRPTDIPLLRPFRMYNVDEEFDKPSDFYEASEIPCPRNSLEHSNSIQSQKCHAFVLSQLSIAYRSSVVPNQTLNLNLRPFFSQITRKLHHDFKSPDFSDYRNKNTKDTRESTAKSNRRKSAAVNLGVLGGATIAGILTKAVVTTVAGTLQASKATQALSVAEFDVREISPGQTITELWQSKPVFIHRWSDAELAREKEVNISVLRDPQTVEQRCSYPEWLVVIGVCTHLGYDSISHLFLNLKLLRFKQSDGALKHVML
ncbi:hypothetical protein GJ496_007590 [Pomphorhynchus laevis]|nr:hypothetical protein GJ496_007590 [Pomphorhynchus laevis]